MPSVANFGERWPLAYFALPRRYFGMLGGGEIESGAKGSQFVEGRHLSPISGENGLQPIVCCQPARSDEGHFLAVSPELLLAVSPGLFLAVSPGLLLAVSPGLLLAESPGLLLAVSPGFLLAVSPGLFSDSVVRNFVIWFRSLLSWLSWLCD